MCVVSAVSDYGMQIPISQWNWESLEAYKRLLGEAAMFDKVAKQPHCGDPSKLKFMDEVLEHLKAIDARLAKMEDHPAFQIDDGK